MANQAHDLQLQEYISSFNGESDERDLPITCGNGVVSLHSDFTRHPVNGLFVRREPSKISSQSLRASRNYIAPASFPPVDRSSSVRFGGDSRVSSSRSTPGRHKAVIGVVKMQSKMEMSDIRKRLSRRRAAPVTMFPASNGDCRESVPALSGPGERGNGRDDHGWGVLKPLRSSVHLVGMLTKFGCVSTRV